MPCALCQQERPLRQSHIIPEFLYEALYDEKHRMHMLSVIPEKGNSLKQKGLKQPLLCDECEQKISVWEGYATKVLKGGTSLTFRTEGNLAFVSGLDYGKFRLFQLSILWRAGVSSLQFFENVLLGPHEEQIRRLLLAADAGHQNHYCCLMFGMKYDTGVLEQLIMQPARLRLDGQIAYRFTFGGFMWVFLVSSQDLGSPLKEATLRPEGSAVIQIRSVMEMDNLAGFASKLNRMGRLR